VQALSSSSQAKGAVALTVEQLRDLPAELGAPKFCPDHDLVDPIMLLDDPDVGIFGGYSQSVAHPDVH
jgi:hypothetical protein